MARQNKLRVYEMVDHPAAKALTGYLLVRGGVHQLAYGRALENLTGSDLTNMFPTPRIATEKIPVPSAHRAGRPQALLPLLAGGLLELTAVFSGAHPETGEDLEVVDGPPEARRRTTFRRSPRRLSRIPPGGDRGDRARLRTQAGLPKEPSGEVNVPAERGGRRRR